MFVSQENIKKLKNVTKLKVSKRESFHWVEKKRNDMMQPSRS